MLRHRRELVGRVVRSPTFVRSERLASMLTYVCDMTLNGRDAELNEQRIGHDVFGRAEDYDSSVDGIVRTQASRLRQRLDRHFLEEGASEPVRIEIPKGGYVPVFVEQERPAPSLPPLPTAVPAAQHPDEPDAGRTAAGSDAGGAASNATRTTTGTVAVTAALVGCAVLGLLCAGLAFLLWKQRTVAPPPHPLWGILFQPGQTTLEVPGDSGLVLSYPFIQKSVSLSDYLAGKYRFPESSHAPSAVLAPEGLPLLPELSNRRYTSIVDLEVAVALERIATSRHADMQIRYARDVRPNDLKNGNVVLVGAFEGNPWMELFERNMNFALVNDYHTHVFRVLNRAPRNGEPDHWDSASGDPLRRVYGVIALMPNLSGNGNVLVVEGTSMAGVEAAWDFIADDQVALPFLHRIALPDGSLPSFELLVTTQNMGASAVHGDVVAWRTGIGQAPATEPAAHRP